ncbi:hypothetical protein scyTo_0019055, partial [Scyliorhinus torazame]|nr:hypothetical protein [Scyliorhinus torazame]
HYGRPAFSRNLASAFQILSSSIGKKKKAGLKGRAYTELLRQICAAAQLSSCSLIHKLQCWDHEAVPFGVFRHGVLTCLIFMEFVKVSGRLFDVLADSDEADRTLCQVLLEALKDAVNIGDSSSSVGYLDAGSKLAPHRLGQAMERALKLQKNESIPLISKEEFILLTAPLFIEKAQLTFPMDYPYSPPAFRFLTKMWHPNIYENGDVCISILHPPVDDPQSGELPSERWNPTQNVRTILLSVISLLNEPNTFSPANVDASVMFRKWRDSKGKDREYAEIIRKQVLATKAEADKDGVKVPTTLAEYCVKTKAPPHDNSSDLLYDDLYDDDMDDDEDGDGDYYDDDDDSGNEES